jgi:hypothetical protein
MPPEALRRVTSFTLDGSANATSRAGGTLFTILVEMGFVKRQRFDDRHVLGEDNSRICCEIFLSALNRDFAKISSGHCCFAVTDGGIADRTPDYRAS